MIGPYQVALGTTSGDTFTGSTNTIFLGLHGNDVFSNYSASDAYFVGGSGDDVYRARTGAITVIHDLGNSSGDVYVDIVSQSTEQYYAYEVDGRHLGIYNASGSSGVLLVDWKNHENMIETFQTSAGTFDFWTFSSAIRSSPNWRGDFSLSQLGLNANYFNQIISEVVATAAHYEAQPPVVITQAEAASVALLYGAGLGRDPDAPGLNYWIDRRGEGASLKSMAQGFLDSQEFTSRFGDDDAMSSERFVTVMYENVLGRGADTGGLQYWRSLLDTGQADREDVLVSFSSSAENRVGATYVATLREAYEGYWTF